MKNDFSLLFQEGFHGLWGIRQNVFTFQNVKFRLSDTPIEDTPSLVSKLRFCTPGDFISLYNEELVAPITADLFWETYKDTYPSLTKDDYYAIVNEISMAGCDAEGMDANGKEDC